MAAVTRAMLWSGAIATEEGGPTTLAGTLIWAIAWGGCECKSMMVKVSGGGARTTFTTPLSRYTLLSFAETAICACAAGVIDNHDDTVITTSDEKPSCPAPDRCLSTAFIAHLAIVGLRRRHPCVAQ